CRYVPKKTGDKRLVTNFQRLNDVTKRDPWPLPRIQDLFDTLAGSAYFSSYDLLKGFHQIGVDEKSQSKLTITTPLGCFTYVCMPFGIINGPSTFCRA